MKTASSQLSTKSQEPADNMRAPERVVKRFLDILGAAVGIVVASPLFVYVALRLKMGHNGSVIFKQERIGLHGKPFMIYKFRTLNENFEDRGPRLTPSENEGCVSSFGRFLRVRHIDEVPQLLNVLKGDMSIVGPRPERKIFIDKIMEHDSRYKYIYLMRPGLTSKATLFNGYTDTMEKMLQRLNMDLEYLQTRTIAVDAKIVWLTVKMLVGEKKF